ncbi:transaldolase family protein, partial [Leptotrichia shahii]|uniref:transaldolase family protein n=3 Tax=Leptotrichia TaxID=32067 RepID=UPI0028D767C6
MMKMQYFIDTANLESIKKISDIFPIAGVTTNPTIIAKEKRDFKEIINDIFDIIG